MSDTTPTLLRRIMICKFPIEFCWLRPPFGLIHLSAQLSTKENEFGQSNTLNLLIHYVSVAANQLYLPQHSLFRAPTN